jgi:hypothetical protein
MATFLTFLDFQPKVQSFHQCLLKMVPYHPYQVFHHCPIQKQEQQMISHPFLHFPESFLNLW